MSSTVINPQGLTKDPLNSSGIGVFSSFVFGIFSGCTIVEVDTETDRSVVKISDCS